MTYNGRPLRLDDLDSKIVKELITDADVSTSYMAQKYKKPLSTIQRRRTRLERAILSKKYTINRTIGTHRVAKLLITTGAVNAETAAKELYEKHPDISDISIGMNSTVNIMATLYFKDTEALHNTMQKIAASPTISNVTFYEIVKVIGEREIGLKWLTTRS